jgi:hypothetical protein
MVYFIQFGRRCLVPPWHQCIIYKWKYAKYILSYNHEYGLIVDTMEILNMTQKGVTIDVYEWFRVYKCRKYEGYLESNLW